MPDERESHEPLGRTNRSIATGESARPGEDVVVAIDGWSAKSRMQSADVILGDARTPADGQRWIVRTSATYPGYLVAGARHERGQWCLLAVRGLGTVLIRTDQEPLDSDVASLLARTCYLSVVVGRSTQVLRDLREASPVPIQVTFLSPGRIDIPTNEGGAS
jgi:hypothetical protein